MMNYQDVIGKQVYKKSRKPFKSGEKIGTVTGVIPHPKLDGEFAYTFIEDDSFVECRRCIIIK